MFTSYEVDYNGRRWKLGDFETIKEACKAERKALKASNGEFPTFTTNGRECVTNNGKPFKR